MRVGLAPTVTNYADVERVKAASRGEEVGSLVPAADHDYWTHFVTLAEMTEPLGFDSFFTFDRHSSPFMMMPNPYQLLAYIAGRTTKIDLGTVSTMLPFHHPVRLAETISLLQHLLGPQRKFTLGCGRSLVPREYRSMGLDISEQGTRFGEALDVLRLALSQERFSYHGEHFNYTDASVRPRPLDPSVGDDAYAILFPTEDSKVTVAKDGFHPTVELSWEKFEAYSKILPDFYELRAQSGYGPAKPPILLTYLYCCESEQEARDDGQKFMREHLEAATWHTEAGSDHYASPKGYDPVVAEVASNFRDAGTIQAFTDKILGAVAEDGVVGTPEQCIETIARLNELIMPSEVVLWSTFGSMSTEQASRSVKLFAERVLPTVQKMTNANIAGTATREL